MKLTTNAAISESGFVFLPSTGESFTVNEIGRFVLTAMQNGKDRETILGDILNLWDADRPTAERGLDDFLAQLKQYQLLTDLT